MGNIIRTLDAKRVRIEHKASEAASTVRKRNDDRRNQAGSNATAAAVTKNRGGRKNQS